MAQLSSPSARQELLSHGVSSLLPPLLCSTGVFCGYCLVTEAVPFGVQRTRTAILTYLFQQGLITTGVVCLCSFPALLHSHQFQVSTVLRRSPEPEVCRTERLPLALALAWRKVRRGGNRFVLHTSGASMTSACSACSRVAQKQKLFF